MGCVPSCGININPNHGDGRQSHLTLISGNSANSNRYSYFPILVDPARGYCYQGPTKPCESNVAIHGVLLSNTWITCPWVRHNPGKLGIIPDNAHMLECFLRKMDSSAQGWVCGLSGSSGCNVPTSLRRVRVVRARARRWILRHESRPYGAQQARKLYNAGNRDKGTPSASILCWLSGCVKYTC